MRLVAVTLVSWAGLALGGCGGTAQLLQPAARPSPPPHPTPTRQAPSGESIYLARLGAAQTALADAEQRIPTNPRTPAALAHSVDLLVAAVRRLAAGLGAIKPPANVAADHARLIAIMRTYAAQLDQAARIAVRPNAEQRAGTLLLRATDEASRTFTATTTRIDSTLASEPS